MATWGYELPMPTIPYLNLADLEHKYDPSVPELVWDFPDHPKPALIVPPPRDVWVSRPPPPPQPRRTAQTVKKARRRMQRKMNKLRKYMENYTPLPVVKPFDTAPPRRRGRKPKKNLLSGDPSVKYHPLSLIQMSS